MLFSLFSFKKYIQVFVFWVLHSFAPGQITVFVCYLSFLWGRLSPHKKTILRLLCFLVKKDSPRLHVLLDACKPGRGEASMGFYEVGKPTLVSSQWPDVEGRSRHPDACGGQELWEHHWGSPWPSLQKSQMTSVKKFSVVNLEPNSKGLGRDRVIKWG